MTAATQPVTSARPPGAAFKASLLDRLPPNFKQRRARPKPPSLLTTEAEQDVIRLQRSEEELSLMFELRRTLCPGGQADSWFFVAYELAREFIPAFQESLGRRGRQTKWSVDTELELVMAVRALRHFGIATSVKGACRKLEKLEHKKYRTTDLYRRYREAITQPALQKVLELADAYDRVTGAVDSEPLLRAYLPAVLRDAAPISSTSKEGGAK
jgi:hypothetical protein